MKKVITSGMILSVLCSMLLFGAWTSAPPANEGELAIVAHIKVKPESKADVLKAFEAVIEGTREEAGNNSYDLWEDTSDPNKFTLIESWKSQQAIDFHNNTDHFKAFVKAIEGKADLEIITLKKKL